MKITNRQAGKNRYLHDNAQQMDRQSDGQTD